MSRRELLRWGAATAAGLTIGPMTNLSANAEVAAGDEAPNLLRTLQHGHPRLLATSGTWEQIKKRASSDTALAGFLKRSEVDARALVPAPPVTYLKQGKRLLHVSRTVLRRVLLLSLHYRLTGDADLARRAEQEMRTVAAFADWNPSHFLDVGEMTAALAFGYDWLYDYLSPEARQIIKTAILDKALRLDLSSQGWLRTENNWNQVCLSGLTLGALALADEEPALAEQALARTRANNIHGLKPYAPDGVYPEGAMYWGYGTTFEVVMLAALGSALGTDWALAQNPGFLSSPEALNQQLGPSGTYFNFSDNTERPDSEPAMWWFARTLKRPELLRYEWGRVQAYAKETRPTDPASEQDRLLPLIALWWPEQSPESAKTKAPRNWHGRGPNPLATFRGDWNDKQTMYLALKGGGAPLSHAHMDAGSFVFESEGVRWACDLGMQNYYSLESKGIDLWNGKQDSQRWQIFRLGPFSHSTLTINDQIHRADGRATITHFADSGDATGAVVNLSPVFKGQAERVTRGFVFRPGSHVLIRDEIEGLKEGDTIRWALLTRAEVSLAEAMPTEATLTQSGKKLQVRLLSPTGGGKGFEVESVEKPKHDYDAPNPGMRLLIVHATAPASGKVELSIALQQSTASPVVEKLADVAIEKWPLAAVSEGGAR